MLAQGLLHYLFPALFDIVLRIFTKRKLENVTGVLGPDRS